MLVFDRYLQSVRFYLAIYQNRTQITCLELLYIFQILRIVWQFRMLDISKRFVKINASLQMPLKTKNIIIQIVFYANFKFS